MDTGFDLLTSDEMRAGDRQAVSAGVDSYQLMQRAGESVASSLLSWLPVNDNLKVLVVAGPGNNGGDGLVAASYLARRGAATTVWLLQKRSRDISKTAGKSDAVRAFWILSFKRTEPLPFFATSRVTSSIPVGDCVATLIRSLSSKGRTRLLQSLEDRLSSTTTHPHGWQLQVRETCCPANQGRSDIRGLH